MFGLLVGLSTTNASLTLKNISKDVELVVRNGKDHKTLIPGAQLTFNELTFLSLDILLKVPIAISLDQSFVRIDDPSFYPLEITSDKGFYTRFNADKIKSSERHEEIISLYEIASGLRVIQK